LPTAFCFDLDGTVTRREILPIIAAEVDLAEEIGLLTKLTIQGLIPFETSFRLRCRILKDVPVSRVRRIVADVPLDAEIEAFLKANRERCAIATGNLDVWVGELLRRLGCAADTTKGFVRGDRLLGIGPVLRKDAAVRALRRRGFTRVVAIGESFNDVPMFEAADVGVAFGGVHAPAARVRALAHHAPSDGRSLCRLLDSL
jgi:HAD superfamily phosphoserine phosphatase-like hydrolase